MHCVSLSLAFAHGFALGYLSLYVVDLTVPYHSLAVLFVAFGRLTPNTYGRILCDEVRQHLTVIWPGLDEFPRLDKAKAPAGADVVLVIKPQDHAIDMVVGNTAAWLSSRLRVFDPPACIDIVVAGFARLIWPDLTSDFAFLAAAFLFHPGVIWVRRRYGHQ